MKMKAFVYEKYGPPEVLKPVERVKPIPKDNEVLIKIYTTSVTVADVRMRGFDVPRAMWIPARLYLGIFSPRRKILGMEIAGVVEAIGSEVKTFNVGDAVLASTFEIGFGGYAEYIAISEDKVLSKPANLDYGEAATIIGGGMTAFRCLEKGNIKTGQSVLIYGASGAVGTNAVQLAKHYYGADVTAVCSTRNLELVKSIGADEVIDYTVEDFAQRDEKYDVVFDAVAKLPARHSKKGLKLNGVYLHAHKHSDDNGEHGTRMEQLARIKQLVEDGTLRPVIDRCYSFDEIVEAHRYVEQGHKRGNVVINVTEPS